MNRLKATVRVIPSAQGDARPEPARVNEAAERLSSLGFRVLRKGRFGVSVTGTEDHFKRELGFEKPPSAGATRDVTPRDGRLAELVDQVEVAPMPQLLGE